MIVVVTVRTKKISVFEFTEWSQNEHYLTSFEQDFCDFKILLEMLQNIGAIYGIPEPLDLLEAGPKELRKLAMALSASPDRSFRDITAVELGGRIFLAPHWQGVPESAAHVEH
jgi:hypothetical protein